jgi:hypothetical protein
VQTMTKKQIAALLRKLADELDGIRDKSKTSNKMVDALWEKAWNETVKNQKKKKGGGAK